MTSPVNIQNVVVFGSIAPFSDGFEFEVTLERTGDFPQDLELDFQVVYVPTPSREDKDLRLENVSVGPIPQGICKFKLTAPPPNPELIDEADLVGSTVLLVRVLYRNCEFVRIGYLVNVDYLDETIRLQAPSPPLVQHLYRHILAEKPRVTRFHLNWENPQQFEYPREIMEQPEIEDENDLMNMESEDEDMDEDSSDDDDNGKEKSKNQNLPIHGSGGSSSNLQFCSTLGPHNNPPEGIAGPPSLFSTGGMSNDPGASGNHSASNASMHGQGMAPAWKWP